MRRAAAVRGRVLWPEAGGRRLVPWLNRHYRIRIGRPNVLRGWWGSTQVTTAARQARVATAIARLLLPAGRLNLRGLPRMAGGG